MKTIVKIYTNPKTNERNGDIDQENNQDCFKDKYSFNGCWSNGTGHTLLELNIISSIIRIYYFRIL